ncbi:MAG: hypothetical protein JWP34_4870 [Massilia sp.]|nr:hypothetical protein [Massilia sp.]
MFAGTYVPAGEEGERPEKAKREPIFDGIYIVGGEDGDSPEEKR